MIIGFIGSGNMAAAMARGWMLVGGDDSPEMLFTDSGSGRATALAEEVGGTAVAGNDELVKAADFVVLAMKPAALETVAADLPAPGAILSLLGATTLRQLVEAFPESQILRLMPNLAVEVGAGVIAVAEAAGADPDTVADAIAQLESLGMVVRLADDQMDAATAVMGCSPAYFAAAADALAHAGVAAGLDPDLSVAMVAKAMAGTAELLAHRTPFEIRVAVASPGGSTEAGHEAFEAADGAGAFEAAARASLARMRGE